jgi:hypothetical protein
VALYSLAAGHLQRLNKKNHSTETKYTRLAQTFPEQEDSIVFLMFTNFREQHLRKAALGYITLNLDEVYIAYFIETRKYAYGKQTITALDSKNKYVISSVRLPIEYRM